MRLRKSDHEGLVLVELLVVVALMVVLTVLYFNPSGHRYQRRAREACSANLQMIHLALGMYASDYGGRYPASRSKRPSTSEPMLSLLVPRHTARTSIFICPGSRDRSLPEAQPFAEARISYAYLMGLSNSPSPGQWLMSDRQLDTRPHEAGELVFSTRSRGPGSNHGQFGGNVLFLDGHVEWTPPAARWPLAQPAGTVALNPRP